MAIKKLRPRIGKIRPLLDDEAERQLMFLCDHHDRNASATIRLLIKQEYFKLKKKV